MAIINPLPFAIVPGTLEDANQVQGNFNWIVDQVNANITPIGSGTNMTLLGGSAVNAVNGVGVVTVFSPTKFNDALNEFNSAAGTFTPTNSGIYRFWGIGEITSAVATTPIHGINQTFQLYINGVDIEQFGLVEWPFPDAEVHVVRVPCSGAQYVMAGEMVTFRLQCVFGGTGLTGSMPCLQIERLA